MRRLACTTAAFLIGITGMAVGLSYQPGTYNVDPCAITTAHPCSQDVNGKAHDAIWADAGKHLPENVGDTALEVIVIELKK